MKSQIDADILRIEPAEEGLDYAANNYALGSALISAIKNNPNSAASYPAIKPTSVNFDDYKTIIVATPLWWSQMAAPLQSFLFSNGSKMAGKTIGLVVSSASSGISGVEADAKRLIPNGKFLNKSLWIRSSQTSDCHSMIADWLKEIGYKGGNSSNGDDDNESSAVVPGNSKILIAYFSRWGNTNYPADVDASTGASVQIRNGVRQGTNQIVAEYIRSAIGGDLHLIETTNPYPVDFDDVRDLNHTEQANGTLPSLKSRIENMAQYETVFIGYPVWATDVPQAIRSFLAQYDFTGKKVVPFCTHDGYGAGHSYRSVADAATGATVLDGIAISAANVLTSEQQITQWLEHIGIEPDVNNSADITVTAGGKTFTGMWLDTPLAKEVREMFPLKVSLGKYGNREYYGALPQRPSNTEDGQLTFVNGDITYCPANNTIAIFYAKADDPDMGHLGMRVIPIGRITSSLTPFDELGTRLEFTFADAK